MGLIKNERRKTKILLVDDEPDHLTVLSTLLAGEGYSTSCVNDGREALAWIDQYGHPDVILLDINMPVMDGAEFMATYNGSAAVIVCTGWSAFHLPRKPFHILYKPIRINLLLETIKNAIAAKGGPKWKHFLPCEHTCISLDIRNDELIFTCLIPGCEKCKAVHKDQIDFETVLELTVSIAQDNLEREDEDNLS